MGEINPITSTSCEKMTGTRVHHVEHSKKSRDPSFEHLRFYGRNLPIKKHIPNTLVGVCWEFPFHHFTRRFKRHLRTVLFRRKLLAKHEKEDSENELHGRNLFGIKGRPALYANRRHYYVIGRKDRVREL